jgi:hypothetical protein
MAYDKVVVQDPISTGLGRALKLAFPISRNGDRHGLEELLKKIK